MASSSSQPPHGVACMSPSEFLDQSDESTVRCNTPSSSSISDSTPTRRVRFRCKRTGRVYSVPGTSDVERPNARDEFIADLTVRLASLSPVVDDLSLKHTSSPVVVDSGTWSTPTVRSWDYPQLETVERVKSTNGFQKAQGRVKFTKEFKTVPTVQVRISAADASKDANFRVKVYATGVDTTGFVAHVDTWGDSKLCSCEVSWVAIGS
ncbi:hypothetical protein NW752_001289 [Fusarium irregulare]|uniref:H-type lectin domain-containing protein n=1 Tax=Fusarium irregulare TaxID=2494466 RepID=A0A9W8U6A4_9HYPO|nr:hypothetical protein NW766_010869 [Fusarium irregulare]KAJ4026349.1 hypothetical protein NW752_001289 [Fusarium irregulare]